jgi:hypothetical protein
MFYPPNPEQNRDRSANAAITRAQLRIQMAKLRKGIRHSYRWLVRGESRRSAGSSWPPT